MSEMELLFLLRRSTLSILHRANFWTAPAPDFGGIREQRLPDVLPFTHSPLTPRERTDSSQLGSGRGAPLLEAIMKKELETVKCDEFQRKQIKILDERPPASSARSSVAAGWAGFGSGSDVMATGVRAGGQLGGPCEGRARTEGKEPRRGSGVTRFDACVIAMRRLP